MNTGTIQDGTDRKLLITGAWLSILVISDLPDIIVKFVTGNVPASLFWYKTAYLCFFLVACILIRSVSRLMPFAIVMLVFYLSLAGSDILRRSSWWAGLISDNARPSFFLLYLRPFIRDAGVTLMVILALFLVKKKRSGFFLVKGDLRAGIEPVKWLGIKSGESWKKFGWIFAVIAALAVAVPTILVLKPSGGVLIKCLPLLPAVLIYAALNAFNEELYFRASLLSTLPEAIGRTHALLLSVVFFGLAHYLYGSPPGITGALMTGFLAFLLGKSMLETKGFLWPWLIHFLPDVVIFFSYAMVWVKQM
jgi:membrane protease YdiL (CAAX protease family)